MSVLGPIISAATSLVGGYLNRKQAKKDRQYAAAREDSSVQRRVADAKAAGVHPLYALGAPLSSSVPQSIGGTSFGDSIANMGQDIGRALDAGRTHSERATAYTARYQQLTLDNMELQNQLLASKIAVNAQAGSPPALPEIPHKNVPPEMTSPGVMLMGKNLYNPGLTSDAQTHEDIGGEGFGDWLAGPLNYIAMMKYGLSDAPGVVAYRNYRKAGGKLGVQAWARKNGYTMRYWPNVRRNPHYAR